MRIALVNYRYFFSGGPERYLFNIKEILESNGHEVIPFSIQHKKNHPTEYEKYFLSPIGKGDEVYFGEYDNKSLKDNIKGFARMTYSFEAKRKFRKFLEDVKPDLVYILYFQNKISCSIVDVAYSMNIPVVQRISDFSLLCPCGSFYKTSDNSICEDCIKKGTLSSVKNKCVYNSALYSGVKVLGISVQNFVNIRKKIKAFVFPSTFTMGKFIEAGYPKEKLHHIPTLFNKETLRKDVENEYGDFALYIGRIVPEKGLYTMIQAFVDSKYKLKIIGFSDTNYQEELENYLKDKSHHIEFLGKMDFSHMQEYLSKCLFTIIPSEWYDNLPNTILESYAFGKGIVATDLGSLSENVIHEKSGLLFKYKDVASLRACVNRLFTDRELAKELGQNGLKLVQGKYSIDEHYNKLTALLESVKNTNGKKK